MLDVGLFYFYFLELCVQALGQESEVWKQREDEYIKKVKAIWNFLDDFYISSFAFAFLASGWKGR